MVCSCAMSSIFVWLQISNSAHEYKIKPSFSPSCDCCCAKMADHFASRRYSLKKQTLRSNDKTIIELGYCKISWFVSVSQINYLLQPSASANNIDLLTTDTGLKITLTVGCRTWWPAKYFLAWTNPDYGWSNNEYYSFFFAQGISNYPGNRSLLLHWHSHFWQQVGEKYIHTNCRVPFSGFHTF